MLHFENCHTVPFVDAADKTGVFRVCSIEKYHSVTVKYIFSNLSFNSTPCKQAMFLLTVMQTFLKLLFQLTSPYFITSLVGCSVIIDYQLVISLFLQLMVTQLRIME